MSLSNLDKAAKKAGLVGINDVPLVAGLARGLVDNQDRLVQYVNRSGQVVDVNQSNTYTSTKTQATLTGNRTITFPNATGTIQVSSPAVLAETRTILASETGSTFFLNSATEFVSTLPAPFLGAKYTFIVSAAPASASYTVVSASSANVIKGTVHSSSGGNAGSSQDGDTVTFADGVAVAGDKAVFESDGTSWFVTAFCDADAGITITQASA